MQRQAHNSAAAAPGGRPHLVLCVHLLTPSLTHLFSDYLEANPIHEVNSSVLYYLNQKDDYLVK